MGGERAAVAAVAAGIEDEIEEQLALFGEPETEEGQRRVLVKRGPGRPKGARNKRTERTVAWLLAQHEDPRRVLLAIAESNVADLAARLGCTLVEALQEVRIAASAVLPFVAQRLPLAVDVTNRQVVHLTIHEGSAALPPPDSGGVGLTATIIDNVEFQDVSEAGDEQV